MSIAAAAGVSARDEKTLKNDDGGEDIAGDAGGIDKGWSAGGITDPPCGGLDGVRIVEFPCKKERRPQRSSFFFGGDGGIQNPALR